MEHSPHTKSSVRVSGAGGDLSYVLGRCQIQSRRQCPSHSRGPLAKSHHILKTHILMKKESWQEERERRGERE